MAQHIAGTPGIRLDRSHIKSVTTREELIYLLSRAAELEHSLACIYLFAAYSLKNDVSEGCMTDEQAEMVRGWRRHLTSTGATRIPVSRSRFLTIAGSVRTPACARAAWRRSSAWARKPLLIQTLPGWRRS